VVAHNDLVALGVLSRLAERGIAVPGDVSVVGVDDTTLAATSNPTLTTVHMPARDFGTHAVDLLFDMLGRPHADDNAEHAPHVLLETELIVRRSTGPHQP
jgi:DNA-binding LacI/PurR family transcriptional regulator